MLALVVDNDRLFRQLLHEILTELGHTVITAADGLEALEAVMRTPPDIIFLDLVMPKVGGDRVCHYLKSDAATSSIPIVILSATVAEDAARIMTMGADAYIAKSPAPEVRANVHAVLKRLAEVERPPDRAVFGMEHARRRGIIVELLGLKRHHETILAEVAEGVIDADAAARVVYVNPAAERLLGRAERDMIGRDLPSLFDPVTARELRTALSREQRALNLTLTNPSQVLVLHLSPLGGEDREKGWLVVLQDQTELWEKIGQLSILNQRLRALDQARSDFLAMASHDLKTPLTSIRCRLDLLADPRLPTASREDVLNAVRQDADRLGQLVSDLLDSARIEAGKLDLHLAPLRVDLALQRAVDQFRGVAAERGVQLQIEIGERLPPISADPGRLDQILCNLLANAIKAMEPGGRIALKARLLYAGDTQLAAADVPRDSSGVELAVVDDGPGIPDDHLPHVFEKFYRAGGGEGTGLGLYICRALVELHSGRIAAENLPSGGTCIRFWLPASDVAPSSS